MLLNEKSKGKKRGKKKRKERKISFAFGAEVLRDVLTSVQSSQEKEGSTTRIRGMTLGT